MAKEVVKAAKLHPKLAKFKASVEKRTNIRDVFVEPNLRLNYINTGSTVLNMLVGGSRLNDGSFVCPGWPRGRIVEIYGRESSGKSTIAMSAMAQALFNGGKQDGCGLYVDLECAVVDKYAQRIGVDFRSVEQGGSGQAIRAQPHTFEETEALVMNAALNGVDIVVVDSVAGLVSEREIKRNVSDDKQKQTLAEIPRLMSNWMPKLQSVISRTGTLVIFLNQTRDKIGAMGYTEEALKSTTGGNALKFWASIRILLKPKQSTKAKRFDPVTKEMVELQIATDIEAKMIKNKVDAKQGHSGLLTIRYGIGVDELRTMLNVAEAYKIVKVEKPKKKEDDDDYSSSSKKKKKPEPSGKGIYVFTGSSGERVEGNGIERFRLAIGQNPELLSEMLEQCKTKLVEGYDMVSDEELAALAEGAVSKRHDDDEDYVATDAPEEVFDEQEEPDDPNAPDPVECVDANSLLDD
ncbi:MAG: hypothetical protein WC708_00440 [Lentisphaeria bacterium]|jgi:recombination protein RecA